jgi:hypothetical protein
MQLASEVHVLKQLNTVIRVDAKRYNITNFQLSNLAILYYQEHEEDPETLTDLLEVLV